MKLTQFVADFISQHSSRVYGVVGAGAMHLNDAICNHPKIEFIAMHHEQAAAMAAEADARVTNKMSVVSVTTGPGGTNAITGVAAAWVDSIPMLVIAGQVTRSTINQHGLRQFGTNELGVADLMRKVTKLSLTVVSPENIRRDLEMAVHKAMEGRRGPVFIEVPLDVQAAEIDPAALHGYEKPGSFPDYRIRAQEIERAAAMINAAERPLILAGNGIRLAGSEDAFWFMVNQTGIPVVTSWAGIDLVDSNHPLVIGRPGIMGDRAGNFAVQNCDLLIALGSRLSVPQTGHGQKQFAPDAKRIIVDIDHCELRKPVCCPDERMSGRLAIHGDVGDFIRQIEPRLHGRHLEIEPWRQRCHAWKQSYPVVLPEYRDIKAHGVNSYAFVEELSKHLDDEAIIVTDVGAAYLSTMQALKIIHGQRLFHSGGVSAMGCGIPMAIGAAKAAPGRQVVCLVGDGGAMVNIQELAVIAREKLPIKIFVYCNDGYMTMQHTQNTHFGREAASSSKSGFGGPLDFIEIASAFGINPQTIAGHQHMGKIIRNVLSMDVPVVCELYCQKQQVLAPRLVTKINAKGEFVVPAFDDMWPALSDEELRRARSGVNALEAAE